MPTLLFTDIESSTRLWEEHPAAMADALARHDEIVTKTINARGGTVLKGLGDGMIAIFDHVADVLAAAVDAQIALTAEEWGSVGAIRVRMGIHAGETEIREGDHYGPAMNRAARVMAAAHGGQVLVSDAAARMAEPEMPAGVGLVDLGVHRLKDLTLPEHLYQLAHPSLQLDFPAPLTLDARPHNLPVQTTEFHGRESELAAISVMLSSPHTRLLTITGPGGAGKTRLGLQLAAEQLNEFRDGVYFVDLSAERDPDAAMEAIVRALDLPAGGGGGALETLTSRLRDRRMLLVLDNFEQVTSAGPRVVELLQQAPGLKVVVTSRETLRVRAEHVFPVPPMGLPNPSGDLAEITGAESVQLFAERARSVKPQFTVDESNAAVVAEICLRLDGLPLAIELAAARLNVFNPGDLLDRLRQRLDILGAGGRDLPDRQRTLWGAIGWSYELLTETERDLFEVLAVFSTADLVALESVASAAGANASIIDDISSLVDKSLLRVDESGATNRFSMLLMIREFAAERLAADPARDDRVRQAHAEYYSGIADRLRERLQGEHRAEALEELAREIGNLRSAWRYWVHRKDLEQLFHMIDGLWALHEAKGWYQAAIELANDALGALAGAPGSEEHAAEELTLRTSLARALMAVYGYDVRVEEAFRKVLEMTDETSEPRRQYPVLRALASYYMNTAQADQCAEIGRQLLELGERQGEDAVIIEAHYLIGASICFQGDIETGMPHLDRVIELYDPRTQGSSRFRLGPNTGVVARIASGLILWQCGALERAVARVEDGLAFAHSIDHPYSVAYAIYHNGFLDVWRGRFDDCLARARELRAVATDNEYVLWGTLATVLEGVGRTGLGETDAGLKLTEAGVDLYRGLTTPPAFWPFIQLLRAVVHAMAGQPDRALDLVDDAISTVGPNDATTAAFRSFRGDILTMLPVPDVEAAEESYREAARSAREGGLHTVELEAMTRLVDLRRRQGKEPDLSAELADLYATFTEGRDEQVMLSAAALMGTAPESLPARDQ